MQCPKCSFENRSDARFCKQCGQALLAETIPSMPPLPTGVVCPACGASTAKPGARFCLRCGKPLPSAVPAQPPAPPSPQAATQPVMSPAPTVRSPSARPPGGAAPPSQPPPPPPSQPPPSQPPPSPPRRKRRPAKRSLKWVWIAVGVGALACVAILVAAIALAVWQGWLTIPIEGLPGAPAATTVVAPTDVATDVLTEKPPEAPTERPPPPPPPEQGPFVVEVSFSSEEVKVGEEVVVTVNVTNNSPDPVGELRYRLAGDWDLFLEPVTEVEVLQGEDIPPGETGTATFMLKGKQAGEAGVRVSVRMIVRAEPPVEKELISEHRMIRVVP